MSPTKKKTTKKTAKKAKATKTVKTAKTKAKTGPSTGESLADRQARTAKIIKQLKKLYPAAECALHHNSAFELAVSTILSAQCTDDRVNMVTPSLFAKYPDAESMAKAKPADVEEIIKSTGFFRNKTKSVIGLGKALMEEHGGEVPQSMDELVELPGIARKTANVILGTWFRKNEGVVVDTHIGRLAHRLGLTWRSRDSKDAVKIEQDLMEVCPRKEWTYLGHALIWHGRKVCSARKPDCENCTLADLCPSAFAENGA